MTDLAIRVENLGKRYRLGRRAHYKTLRSVLADTAVAPFRSVAASLRGQAVANADSANFIWALKGLSFEIRRGELVGTIGRNGAGKSTLLKILSRITEPTEGSAKIRGRVGSLLEVGTGFHPELTGRENIYLNGAILGMRKREIARKFDEIVAFAEVERFVDTPVKHYSSGMYVRLAFAVAAHLEPEILLVDEVLAVGDAEFQKKCLGKMGDVSRQGRTVLFVSHNMGAVMQLCERALWLEEGRLVQAGPVSDIVRAYLSAHTQSRGEWTNPASPDAEGSNVISIRSVRVVAEGAVAGVVAGHAPFQIEINYSVRTPVRDCIIWLNLINDLGVPVLTTLDTDSADGSNPVREPGSFRATCELPGCFLKPQKYIVSVGAGVVNRQVFDQHQDLLQFEVTEPAGFQHLLSSKRQGVVAPKLPWRISKIE